MKSVQALILSILAIATLMVVVGCFAANSQALAQTVDVRPAVISGLDWLAGALITVLTVLASIASRFMFAKVGVANSELERMLNDRLNDGIHRGIEFALIAAKNEVAKQGSGLDRIKLDNWLMATVVGYVQPRFPGILARFNIDKARLEEMILARINNYFPVEQASVTDAIGGALATTPTVREVNRDMGHAT